MVIDASALVYFLAGSSSDALDELIASERLQAPSIVDLEFLSALRRLERLAPSDAAAGAAVTAFGTLAIRRYEPAALRDRIWQLRHNFSPYDASYVALAEALEVPLLTADLRFARAADALVEIRTP